MLTTQELIDNIGKKRGHFKTKSNRIAKLIEDWPSLESKFVAMVERGGGQTKAARMAYGVLLMMETGIRVGNESSAEGFVCDNQRIAQKANPAKGIKKGDILYTHPMHGQTVQTYGLTTLINEHVKLRKKSIKISFLGKKLVDQELITKHPTLIKHCPIGPKGDSFLDITYPHLKSFIKTYVGKGYTPKDLRMTKVNLIFVNLFGNKPFNKEFEDASSKSARNKILGNAIEQTACIIGHTKGVCKSAYLSKDMIQYIQTRGTATWQPKE